jgi:hypothetical protein
MTGRTKPETPGKGTPEQKKEAERQREAEREDDQIERGTNPENKR